MTIWAIADIHASPLDESGRPQKPMSIFGPQWNDHVERIEAAWTRLVHESDTVIVAGDTDWAMHLEEARSTLERIGEWPGRKILVRGNHDYWWSSGSTNKVRAVLPESITLLHNNAFQVEGFNVIGGKGSPVPGAPEWTPVEEKLLHRETERFKLSMAHRDSALPSIAAMHYPPIFRGGEASPYIELFAQAGVALCVYGHLHGGSARTGVIGDHSGVIYRLVAADNIDFAPVPVARNGTVLDGVPPPPEQLTE